MVLLSGGLDSATAAAVCRDQGFAWHALTVDYGQRHRFEVDASRRVAQSLGAAGHRVLRVDLTSLRSALTGRLAVPKGRSLEEVSQGIPETYVPARNTILLALALGVAETLGAADIFIGVNAVDYSGYPDCRPEFIAAFETLAGLATKAGVEGTMRFCIHAPLVQLAKADIIRLGTRLGVNYALTHSCYDPAPDGAPCGECDACLLRQRGFDEAGLADPAAQRKL